jgi:hypothetical protein
MKTFLIVSVAALTLAACAEPAGYFVKPGASTDDLRRDAYACEKDARSVSYSFGTGMAAPLYARDFAMRCMAASGWSYTTAPQPVSKADGWKVQK